MVHLHNILLHSRPDRQIPFSNWPSLQAVYIKDNGSRARKYAQRRAGKVLLFHQRHLSTVPTVQKSNLTDSETVRPSLEVAGPCRIQLRPSLRTFMGGKSVSKLPTRKPSCSCMLQPALTIATLLTAISVSKIIRLDVRICSANISRH